MNIKHAIAYHAASLLIVVTLCSPVVSIAEDLMRGPDEEIVASAPDRKTEELAGRMDRQAGVFLLFVYQKLISPQLNTNCQFYPSCSEYAKQSVYKYGVFRGYTMGIERFIRCNRKAKKCGYPLTRVGEDYRMLDLPESNVLTRTK